MIIAMLNILHSLCRWQIAHNAARPDMWLQAIGLGRLHKRIDDGTGMGTVWWCVTE